MNEQADLLTGGWAPLGPEPVEPIELADEPRWERIVLLPENRPPCMHCQLVAGRKTGPRIQRAAWQRIGVDGSLLDLCIGHTEQQRERDGETDERAA